MIDGTERFHSVCEKKLFSSEPETGFSEGLAIVWLYSSGWADENKIRLESKERQEVRKEFLAEPFFLSRVLSVI
ncbi:hypothetical protein NPIL_695131 [Nephila pilipes]|uniref:Uncharacterized protein n=1 Tax=Nephila pilipes TaxID=299642 RepID=A0A8X6NHQ5_NEPPI|nr:hypothetical protein NPIL_695131 [Nephila pilipes]